MEKKHITEGQLTIDIREYRELVEAATIGEEYRNKYFDLYARMTKEGKA